MSERSSRPRLLLVDDDPAVRLTLTRYLQSNFDVVTASEAEEAVRLMTDTAFDVVVSDFEMPGKNGIWLLNEARTRLPSARRVLISGLGADKLKRDFDPGLVHLFLQKPLTFETFVDAVLTVLR